MKKLLLIRAMLLALSLAACANAPASSANYTSLEAYPVADMSGYACAADYDKEYRFRNMTVAEMAAEMDAHSTFIVYTGFDNCPWCNVVLNPLNDLATERGIEIAYIDTRSDPSWKSNLDLLDYDLFIERVGSVLAEDDNGVPHLYVPHCFFIRNGQLVHDHSGTVPSQASPSDPLSEEELKEYHDIISGYVDDILR